MKKNTRKTARKIFALILAAAMLIAMAMPAAAAQRYPYERITKTNGHFISEELYASWVLLECERFPGKYWTMRSDGWLYLAKLAKDPVAAGQVFVFDRTETVLTAGDKYGSHYEHNQWHLVHTARSPMRWLTQRKEGFYFDPLDFREGTGVLNLPEQQWRLKLVRTEDGHQVIQVICRTKLTAAAAGWSPCIPHEYIP